MPRQAIPANVERRVRELARHRCGYCLSPQRLVMARLEIEPLIPLARGGSNDEANLWLAWPLCNAHQADKVRAVAPATGADVPLFNPRTQRWSEHFRWSEDGLRILGRTTVGRATAAALRLDSDPDALLVRSSWIAAGWHPPSD